MPKTHTVCRLCGETRRAGKRKFKCGSSFTKKGKINTRGRDCLDAQCALYERAIDIAGEDIADTLARICTVKRLAPLPLEDVEQLDIEVHEYLLGILCSVSAYVADLPTTKKELQEYLRALITVLIHAYNELRRVHLYGGENAPGKLTALQDWVACAGSQGEGL